MFQFDYISSLKKKLGLQAVIVLVKNSELVTIINISTIMSDKVSASVGIDYQ